MRPTKSPRSNRNPRATVPSESWFISKILKIIKKKSTPDISKNPAKINQPTLGSFGKKHTSRHTSFGDFMWQLPVASFETPAPLLLEDDLLPPTVTGYWDYTPEN